jgi:hypothetical protein
MRKLDKGNTGSSSGPIIDVQDVTPMQLVESLRRTVCPMCGDVKKAFQTLCVGDYRELPHGRKMALYDRLGEGYEEAVAAAFKARGVTNFILPA